MGFDDRMRECRNLQNRKKMFFKNESSWRLFSSQWNQVKSVSNEISSVLQNNLYLQNLQTEIHFINISFQRYAGTTVG